jgi:iron complex outermembrane receptor protein
MSSRACRHPASIIALMALCPALTVQADERFFQPVPIVLSASRLPQPLSDTPAAMTVIDAEFIAATGYRDLARLFRLVPGMQVAQERGNQQWVTYHGLGAEYPNQMQVLVDGRSIYSPHYSGGANWSAIPLTLQDIDRIEIVRGSNSAAYGSNAFLGVVNILTRHTAMEPGSSVGIRLGSRGIADVTARAVAHHGALGLRISAQEMRDDGWEGLRDDQRLRVFNLRGDLQLDAANALEFTAAYSDGELDVGYAGTLFNGSGERELTQRDYAFHGKWRHTPSADEEWLLSWYHNAERTIDAWRVASRANCLAFCALLPDTFGDVNNNRSSRRDDLELQHRLVAGDGLRILWGAGWRYDRIESDFLFSDGREPTRQEWRLFGNGEWRMAPRWLWNIGAMAERIEGDSVRLAPRVFLNWQPDASRTWRLGYARAWRQPTLHERWVNVVVSGEGLGPVNQRHAPNPDIGPARIDTWELGYLGRFAFGGLLDARIFDEHIRDYIRRTPYTSTQPLLLDPVMGSTQWANMQGDIRLRGIEYQLSFKPRAGTTLLFTHTLINRHADDPAVRHSVAPHTATASWLQEFGPWHSMLSVMRMGELEAGTNHVPGMRYTVPAYTTLDLSIGRRIHLGSQPARVRVTATNLLGRHQELAHKPLQAMPQYRERAANESSPQAFVTIETTL